MSPIVKYIAFILLINTVWCSDYIAPNENSVLVHFMDLKREKFMEALPSVSNAIARAANEFCENQTSSCGNLKNFNITSRNVKFVGANEKDKYNEETRFVISNIYIDNEGAEDEVYVLPKTQSLEFFKKHRNDIVKDGKVEIAYVDNELVYPQRNNLDNYLIIPISCAFCVTLIVLNLICQIKTSKKEKQSLINEAKELKPLIKKPIDPSIHSEGSETRLNKPNVLSRHDSFDQKLDVKSGGKRRKKNRNMVAGSVGSGIGSPRNIAESFDDSQNRSYSINTNGDIQIPITYDQRAYADSRVAYRLASSEDN